MKWKICTNSNNLSQNKRMHIRTSCFFMLYLLFERDRKVVIYMSSLDKMWVSFASMGFMMISMGLIYFSRYKLNNKLVKVVFALVAYILLIIGFITMIFIVFSGPTGRA